MKRTSVFPRWIASLICGSLLAGCGGGGSGGSSPVVPGGGAPAGGGVPAPVPSGPTATFTSRPTAGTAFSQFAVTSNPSGLAVMVGANSAVTPQMIQPAFSTSPLAITFTPSNGRPTFTYNADQTANGNKSIFYNQISDVTGRLTTVSPTTVARSPLSVATLSDVALRRFGPPTAVGRPALDPSRVAVVYRAAMLASTLRQTNDIERTEGVTRSLSLGAEHAGQVTRIVDVPAGDSVASLSARMRTHAEVAEVQPLHLRYKTAVAPVTPNDNHFNTTQQWDMFRIGAPSAWGYSTGSPSIAIAVIDTGFDTHHADLAGTKVTYGEKVVNGTVTQGVAAAQDTDGHGTNVSGIAAAATNNNFGFAGVGFNVSLQEYKIFGDGATGASTADEAQAIYDAVAHGARVINLSLGGLQSGGFDPIERDAVAFAVANNVLVVAASGNERGQGVTTVDFPGAYDGVISVGASSLNDTASPGVYSSTLPEFVASYSNSGPGLGLVAPGGDPTPADLNNTASTDFLHWIFNIYTTTPFSSSAACSRIADCYALFAGTSQATPHVAGAAALLLSLNPALTISQVTQILESTADDIRDANQGHGRLNLYRAMAAVAGDSPPTLPTSANFVAFAYVPNGTTTPRILDVTFPTGVPVGSDGTFRLADIPTGTTSYSIGVWYDANGDGRVDAGDFFGSVSCSGPGPCAGASSVVVHPVANGFIP